MPNIFDVSNVDLFMEKCEDKSVRGSWSRLKAELMDPKNAIACSECGIVAGHWFECSKLNETPPAANKERTDETL